MPEVYVVIGAVLWVQREELRIDQLHTGQAPKKVTVTTFSRFLGKLALLIVI